MLIYSLTYLFQYFLQLIYLPTYLPYLFPYLFMQTHSSTEAVHPLEMSSQHWPKLRFSKTKPGSKFWPLTHSLAKDSDKQSFI